MALLKIYVSQCTCDICRLGVEHPERIWHHHINLLMSRLDEQQRRWLAGLLAEHYGVERGGTKLLGRITGLNEKTIQRGKNDLEQELIDFDPARVRSRGAGRPKRKQPDVGR